jgi:hypothetical protein
VAISPSKQRIESWFSPATREEEIAWADRLAEVGALYAERGFTRGEGAILFMLGAILSQVGSIHTLVRQWDDEDDAL